MNISKIPLLLFLTLFLALTSIGAADLFAEENMSSAPVVTQNEMPLLRGNTWMKMSQDEKVAFVWGMGHIITMERERTEENPECKKVSFAAKMAEGLAGMPMNEVVSVVDRFYKESPDKTGDPVVQVIWMQIVKPRISNENSTPPSEK